MSAALARQESQAIDAITFEGHTIVFHEHAGRPCLIVADAGRALGYASDGKRLADRIRGDWAEEMIEGCDFDTLTGDDLRALKARAGDTPLPGDPRRRA